MIHRMKTVATIAASCPPLLERALDRREADELARVLKVLADPARLRLLSLIQAQPERRGVRLPPHRAARTLAADGQPPPQGPADAGLVTREQRGSWAYYRVVPEALAAVRTLLA